MNEFDRKADYWPTDPEAIKRLERQIDFGELAFLTPGTVSSPPRYLVTYMKSNTSGRIRSGTVVTVTNQSLIASNRVFVFYYRGFSDIEHPDCVSVMAIPPGLTVDFCSRNLPSVLTTCNISCSPELNFHEGRAIVNAQFPIGVSSRVYYTRGQEDEELLAITDSKVVRFSRGNRGD